MHHAQNGETQTPETPRRDATGDAHTSPASTSQAVGWTQSPRRCGDARLLSAPHQLLEVRSDSSALCWREAVGALEELLHQRRRCWWWPPLLPSVTVAHSLALDKEATEPERLGVVERTMQRQR